MVFHARKWGWARIAARLLLVPVLAGGAAVGQAQTRAPAGPSGVMSKPTAGPQQARPGGDPKVLLKEGRKALAGGNLDAAQDLARQADASNPTGKWGLFDDTPNSLLKDVQSARSKVEKAQAELLTKDAKKLLSRPTANDAERLYNLDTALQMARRAEQLHGPYSMWDLGDRADKLAKDIQAARGKISRHAAPTSPNGAANGSFAATLPPAGPSGVRTAGNPAHPSGTMPAGHGASGVMPAGAASRMPTAPAAPADPRKAAALKLMAEGKQHADRGDFAGAKAKYTEANTVGATFDPREPNPGFALQELNSRGATAIAHLLRDAKDQITRKDFSRADATLTAASQIAAALSLFPRPIEEARSSLRVASNGQFGGAPPGGLAPVGGPEYLVATGSPAPQLPAPPASGLPKSPVKPASGTVTGRQLLDQAAFELSKGDLDMANRLALQAHNLGGVQDEARTLLNQIDAEKLAIKQRHAIKSYDAAMAAHKGNDHGHALSILVLIDPNLLPAGRKAKLPELLASCRAEVEKTNGATVVAAGGAGRQTAPVPEPDMGPMPGVASPVPGTHPPGTARVGTGRANPDSVATQADAMRRVEYQKLRADGLKVQADAQAAFGRGDTDVAIQMLLDYVGRVKQAKLESAAVALLLRPIEGRLEMFRVMKGQADALAREKRENREARDLVASRGGAAEEQRKAEIQRLVRQCNQLTREGNDAAAEKLAMQAKQLDPDNEAIRLIAEMSKIRRRVKEQEKIKNDKESFFYNGVANSESPGPFVSIEDPLSVRMDAMQRARRRGSLDEAYLKSRTPTEYEIEMKLDRPVSVEFNQTPLSEVIENLREVTKLPFSFDTASIEAAEISLARPITEKLPGVSARNALHLILDKAGLSFVIEYDSVRITTVKKAKGKLFTKVFSVADLVTPIPNFALPDSANFDKMVRSNAIDSGRVSLQGMSGPTPFTPPNGLANGAPAGTMATTPGIAGGVSFGPGGSLQGMPRGDGAGPSPLNGVANVGPDRNTKHEQLIRLITGMIRPYTWDALGGSGKVEYFDIGSALVVNQTADVILEVQNLLEALRRLQDLAIAVEIRIISLSESFFERMGVDFAMNIKTNTAKFEPNLTSGVFRPEPFINDINSKGVTLGLTPAGSFTPDLDVPIRATSFNYAIPGFGGYPANPGNNGGVSLGLAFLNDIQVFMFMEAAQGDRRVSVMQAPKLTLFNGQTATLSVQETQFFVTNVTVVSVNGQIVFIPNNTLLPGPDTNFQIGIQAVVSADRRFVRLNLPVTMSAQSGTVVPLFPVTTFITPVFEGGSQGVPIPFTQFLQQPAFITLTIQTTVVCPDGGTVLLGGLKTLNEGRNEFGPPFLSKIPYLNRLFKNVGVGRETRHVMIMVTPRIIINSEEEVYQTEGRPPLGGGATGP